MNHDQIIFYIALVYLIIIPVAVFISSEFWDIDFKEYFSEFFVYFLGVCGFFGFLNYLLPKFTIVRWRIFYIVIPILFIAISFTVFSAVFLSHFGF